MQPTPPKAPRWRRWSAAVIATGVIFVVGQAYAFKPVKIFTDSEMQAVFESLEPAH